MAALPRALRRAMLPIGLGLVPAVLAAPQGGQVTGGQGQIVHTGGGATVINQQSNRLALQWQQFDVAAGELVDFRQPSSTATALNRILDAKASQIHGAIQANGKVFLVNTHGIVFGKRAQVNVGALVASGLDISTADFMAGRDHFAGGAGVVVNSGTIHAATGGSVSLVGAAVRNEGAILASLGQVNLGAGSTATLDFEGDGLVRFAVQGELTENAGQASAVANQGHISADGGTVLLQAAAARDVFSQVVNNAGVIRAQRIDTTGGVIRLTGGGAGGSVINTGTLDASGQGGAAGGAIRLQAADSTVVAGQGRLVATGSRGGQVDVLGERVGLFDQTSVDVSGADQGGRVRVGGDYQGLNPDIQNASYTVVSGGASISADAGTGDGGRVIVWSNQRTGFAGAISARGGAQAGDGGFAEVSGKENLAFSGAVDLSAPAGRAGNLLLDPDTVRVTAAGTETNLVGAIGDDGDANTYAFGEDAGDGEHTIKAKVLTDIMKTGTNVALQAHDDIIVDEAIDSTGGVDGGGLSLKAGEDILINAAITLDNADLLLTANDAAATPTGAGDSISNIAINADIDTGGGDFIATIDTAGANVAGTYSQGNVDVVAGGGDISITANGVDFTNNSGNNALQSAGTVTLKTSTAGRLITLAKGGALASDFDLSASEVQDISGGIAGKLVIGDPVAGSSVISIDGAVDFSGVTGATVLAGASFTDGATTGHIITAGALQLVARTGDIGSNAVDGAIDLGVVNLTLETDGSFFVAGDGLTNLTELTLRLDPAGSDTYFLDAASIPGVNAFTLTDGGADLLLGGVDVGAGTFSLTAGSGSILGDGVDGTTDVTASDLTLAAASGSVGSTAVADQVESAGVTRLTLVADADIGVDANTASTLGLLDVTVNPATAAESSYALTGFTGLVFGVTDVGGNVQVADVDVDGAGTGTFRLEAATGSIVDDSVNGTVIAVDQLELVAPQAVGLDDPNTDIDIAGVTVLSVDANDDVGITGDGTALSELTLVIDAAGAAGYKLAGLGSLVEAITTDGTNLTAFTLTSTDDTNISVTVDTGNVAVTSFSSSNAGDLLLAATAGDLIIADGGVATGSGDISLQAGGVIDEALDNATTNITTAGALTLNAGGDIGVAGGTGPLDIDVDSLIASGNALFIANNDGDGGGLILTDVRAGGGDLAITSSDEITATDARAAGNLDLTAAAGDLLVDFVLSGGSATLTATSGDIDEVNPQDGGVDLFADILNMNALNGAIGNSRELEVRALTALSADTSTGGGDVVLTSLGPLPIGLVDAGTGDIILTTDGSAIDDAFVDNVQDFVAANIDLTSNGGAIGGSKPLDMPGVFDGTIDSGGGAISLTAMDGLQPDGTIDSGGGTITLNADSDANGTGTFHLTGTLDAGIGDITITAAGFTDGGGNLNSTGTTRINASTVGRSYALGDDAVGGADFDFNDAVMDLLLGGGGALTIGDANAGNITLDRATAFGGNLTLITAGFIVDAGAGAGVAFDNAALANGTLNLTAGNGIDLTSGAGIDVDSIAATNTTAGNLSLSIAGDVTISGSGIDEQVVSGTIDITAGGVVTVTGNVAVSGGGLSRINLLAGTLLSGAGTLTARTVNLDAANGIAASTVASIVTADNTAGNVAVTNTTDFSIAGSNAVGGSFSATAGGVDSTLSVGGAGILANGGGITLTADHMDLTGGVVGSVGDDVTLLPVNVLVDTIEFVADGTGDTPGILRLTDLDLDSLANTAGATIIGANNGGTITVVDGFDLTGDSGSLTLRSGGSILGPGQSITVPTLAFSSFGPVDLLTAASSLSGTSSFAGNITLTNASAGGLTVTGLNSFGASIALTETLGDVTVANDVAAGGGTLSITLSGNDKGLTNNAVLSGSGISLTADKVALEGGSVNAGAGSIVLRSVQATDGIDFVADGTGDGAANTLQIEDRELDTLTGGSVLIGDAGQSGAIRILAPMTPANVPDIELRNGAGGMAVNDGFTATGNLTLSTGGAIGDDTTGQLNAGGNLTLTAASGIGVIAGNPVHIGTVGGALSATNTTAGDLYLATGGIVIGGAGASLSQVAGGELRIDASAGIDIAGNVAVGGAGQITLQALTAITNSAGSLQAQTLDLDAANGIAASTVASIVTADNTASGNVAVTNTTDFSIAGSNAGGGSFSATAGGVDSTLSVGGAGILANGGGITLTADHMDLTGGVVGSVGDDVTLQQNTLATTIDLAADGAPEAAGVLTLTDLDLDSLANTAGTTTLGRAGGGAITVSDATDLTGDTGVLHLITGAGIAGAGQTLTVPNMAFTAGGVVTLDTAVSTLAGTGTQITVSNAAAGGLTLGAVSTETGLSGGPIILTETLGDVTVANDVAAGGGTLSITLSGNDKGLTNNAVLSGSGISLTADKVALEGGSVNAGAGSIVLRSVQATDGIDFVADGTGDGAANTLQIEDRELDTLTAGSVLIGDAGQSGAIRILAPMTPANVPDIELRNGAGGIAVNDGFTATGNLTLSTGGAIGDDTTGQLNAGGNLTLTAANGIGVIAGNPVHIGTVGGALSATNTTAGDLFLASAGNITLGGGAGLDQQVAGGALRVDAGGDIDITGNVQVSGGGASSVTLLANGTINRSAGVITAASIVLGDAGTTQIGNTGTVQTAATTLLDAEANAGTLNLANTGNLANLQLNADAGALVFANTGTTATGAPLTADSIVLTSSGLLSLRHDLTADVGGVLVTADVNLGAGAVTTTMTGGAGVGDDLVITGSVDDGGSDTTLSLQAGAADIDLQGAIGRNSALGGLDLDGATLTLPDIGGPGALVAGVQGVTNVNASGQLTFTGTRYNTIGSQTYTAAAGANLVIAGGSTTFLSPGSDLSFNVADLAIGDGMDVTFNTTSALGGNILVQGTIRGTGGGATENLTFTSGNGSLQVVGSVGDTAAAPGSALGEIGSVTVVDAASATFAALRFDQDLAITADQIDFVGGAASVVGSGFGDVADTADPENNIGNSRGLVILRPRGIATDIDVGGPGGVGLNLSNNDIAALADHFVRVKIGHEFVGSHTITLDGTSLAGAGVDLIDPYQLNGAVTFNGAPGFSGDGSLQVNGPSIVQNADISAAFLDFNGDVLIGSDGITFTSLAGDIRFQGRLASQAGSLAAGSSERNALNLNSAGDVIFQGDVGSSFNAGGGEFGGPLGNLVIERGNSVSLANGVTEFTVAGLRVGALAPVTDVTFGNGLAALTATGIGNGGALSNLGIDLSAAPVVTLGRDLLLDTSGAAAAPVNLGGSAVDGAFALSVSASGAVTLGSIGQGTALTALSASGTTVAVTDQITTTGDVTLGGAVTLAGGPLTITSGGGAGDAITINGTLNGAGDLVLNAGAGSVSVTGAAGGTTALNSLTANAASIAVKDVTSSGSQTYNGATTLSGDLSATGLTFNGPLVVGPAVIAAPFSISAGTGTLTAGGTIASGANNLVLAGDEIDLNGGAGSVSGVGVLTLQPGQAGTSVGINGGVGTLDISAADLAALQDGFSEVDLGRADGSGTITLAGVTFTDPTRIQSPSGLVVLTGALSGADNADLALVTGVLNDGGQLISTAGNDLQLQANAGAVGSVLLPVNIAVGGAVSASGNGVFLTQASGNLRVGSIDAGAGNVGLTVGGALDDAGNNLVADIAGNDVRILAASIGQNQVPEFTVSGVLDIDTSGAGGDIVLNLGAGNTNVGLINAGSGSLVLRSAGSINDASSGDDAPPIAPGAVDIIASGAGGIAITATGGVGDLRPVETTTGLVNVVSGGGVGLQTTMEVTVTRLEAGGDLQFAADGTIHIGNPNDAAQVEPVVKAAGNIALLADAGRSGATSDLLLGGSILSNGGNGQVFLFASHDVVAFNPANLNNAASATFGIGARTLDVVADSFIGTRNGTSQTDPLATSARTIFVQSQGEAFIVGPTTAQAVDSPSFDTNTLFGDVFQATVFIGGNLQNQAANQALAAAGESQNTNAGEEGYIDPALYDLSLSIFDIIAPGILLPADQREEDDFGDDFGADFGGDFDDFDDQESPGDEELELQIDEQLSPGETVQLDQTPADWTAQGDRLNKAQRLARARF